MLNLRKTIKGILDVIKSIAGNFFYSTDEVWTGKYWIDGKKIYRKVLRNILTTSVSTSWQNYCDISNLNIERIISVNTFTRGNFTIPVGNQGVFYQITGNYLQIIGFSGYGGFTSEYAIIEYTKTTD